MCCLVRQQGVNSPISRRGVDKHLFSPSPIRTSEMNIKKYIALPIICLISFLSPAYLITIRWTANNGGSYFLQFVGGILFCRSFLQFPTKIVTALPLFTSSLHFIVKSIGLKCLAAALDFGFNSIPLNKHVGFLISRPYYRTEWHNGHLWFNSLRAPSRVQHMNGPSPDAHNHAVVLRSCTVHRKRLDN
jgi:hypothetical protein